jgi:squalene-hopene/tetraprenyl-beta-curcumene cyclase
VRAAASSAGLPCWPRSALPAGLDAATALLRSRVLHRMRPDGTVHSPCRSRVLESALLLALIDRTGLHPGARARLASYLSSRCDAPEPLDRLLARAALRAAGRTRPALLRSISRKVA